MKAASGGFGGAGGGGAFSGGGSVQSAGFGGFGSGQSPSKPGEWFVPRSRCAPLSRISLKMKHGRKIKHTNISDVTW